MRKKLQRSKEKEQRNHYAERNVSRMIKMARVLASTCARPASIRANITTALFDHFFFLRTEIIRGIPAL